MPKLIIDNREIAVPEGTKVIAAAEKLGIMIPRFCYHPALGSVGACRVCAVKFEEGPVKGIEMSCMVNAQEGMRVSTSDPEAVDFRRQVIEWLMVNHPHDCPVCDEGGHCLLQDLTVSGGHGRRRYQGPKRTHRDQDLGPLVQHEMNRCIQCYRCVRYYREIMGYTDLGVKGIAARVYFGRVTSGTLQSPFSGNLIDICPTGVFTDKPSRFAGRQWDFERRPSICIHCSLGCHVMTSVRLREVVRQEACFNADINGYFICDRGRYGFYYNGALDRPRTTRIEDQNTMPQAVAVAAKDELSRIADLHGPQAVATLGGLRASLETLLALNHLCKSHGWPPPVFWVDDRQARFMQAVGDQYDPQTAADPRDVARADLVLALGVDPLNEAPMLAPALRQAARNGSRIFMVHPGPLDLPFAFQHLISAPAEFGRLLEAAVSAVQQAQADENSIEPLTENAWPDPTAAADLIHALCRSQNPVILVGNELVDAGTVALADALVRAAAPRPAKVMHVLPGANAMGAVLMIESRQSFTDVLAGIEAGEVRALLLAECDPLWDFPDRRRLEAALASLETLVVLDYVDSYAAREAQIEIPTCTLYEAGGTYINASGRVQHAQTLFSGGLSIAQTGDGGHPPRKFSRRIPGADIPSAWQVLWRMAEKSALGKPDAIPDQLARAFPATTDDGRLRDRIRPGSPDDDIDTKNSDNGQTEPDTFRLLLTDAVFGTELLSSLSPCLQDLEPEPRLWMSAADAVDMGLTDGQIVQIRSNGAALELPLSVSENMAPGCLSLQRQRGTDWRIFDSRSPVIGKEDIVGKDTQ